jgi:hypothetical protein
MDVEEGPKPEDTMNPYIADQLAREHAARLMADAAAARRARRAAKSGRDGSAKRHSGADRSGAEYRPAATAAAAYLARPFVAVHSWLVAGEL